MVRLDWAAAALNAGQAALLAAGMTGAMLAAALGPARAAAGTAAAAAAGAAGAAGAAAGITAGDLVMIQGLLIQLWAPLQFLVRARSVAGLRGPGRRALAGVHVASASGLSQMRCGPVDLHLPLSRPTTQGWFYRELRQSLVDMEDLFALLATPSRLPDGTRALPAAPLPAAAPHGGAGSNGAVQHSDQQQQQEEEALEERRRSNGAASSSSSSSSGAGGSAGGAPQHEAQRQHGGLRVELRDVRFGYGSRGGRQVLRGVSLAAEPGESIAVVGGCRGGGP